MVFYLIGLGLGDVDDISVRGLNIVKKCARVYLEAYTSVLLHGPSPERLEAFYGRRVLIAHREQVESKSDELIDGADVEDVALLVVGDPFGATTHADLVLRATEKNIKYEVVHNASIINAVGSTGLSLYAFGETISIVFWTDIWQPDSYVDKLIANRRRGLHTLCLLDIKVKEQTIENLVKNRPIFEPPRYMQASEAARQLIDINSRRRVNGEDTAYNEETICVAVCRLAWPNQQRIVAGTLKEMSQIDHGPPLHSLIVCGTLHDIEEKMINRWKI